MNYIRCIWNHTIENSPILLYSELDENSFETRKIEMWRNGKIGFASKEISSNSSQLGLFPIPSINEINMKIPFHTDFINENEFDVQWQNVSKGKNDGLPVSHYLYVFKRRIQGYNEGYLKYEANRYHQICHLANELGKYDKDAICKLIKNGNVYQLTVEGSLIGEIGVKSI